jgi:hypothetical protein
MPEIKGRNVSIPPRSGVVFGQPIAAGDFKK